METLPKGRRLRSVSASSIQVKCQVSLCLQPWEDGSLVKSRGGEDGDKDSDLRTEGKRVLQAEPREQKSDLYIMLRVSSLHPPPSPSQPSFPAHWPILQMIKLSPREDTWLPKVTPSFMYPLNIYSQGTAEFSEDTGDPGPFCI